MWVHDTFHFVEALIDHRRGVSCTRSGSTTVVFLEYVPLGISYASS